MTRVHPRIISSHLGDGTSGPCGADLAEEEPWHLVHVDLSH
jgi:hypothetical protein